MPKQFGHYTGCTLVIASLLALVSVGCRTTTSKLASIPGMGWMDRGEKSFGEGWAEFEPAPDLPPPSATTEPSSIGGNSAVASNAAGSKTQPEYGSYTDPAKRTNKDAGAYTPSYLASGGSSNAASQNSDYNTGSTYGKLASYGKNTNTSSNSQTAAPQKGLYSDTTPSHTASATSGSSTRYGDWGSTSTTADNGTTPYGGHATNNDSRYAVPGGSSDGAYYTADRNSRFGSPSTDASANQQSAWSANTAGDTAGNTTSTYTPPGYPTQASGDSASTSGSAGRLDRFQAAAAEQASNAASQLSATARDASGVAISPTNQGGQEIVNSFADSAQQRLQAAAGQAQTAVDGAQNTTSGYADSARETIENAANGASQKIDGINRYGNDAASRFGGAVQGMTQGAQQQVQQATSPALEQLQSNAGSYADALMQAGQDRLNESTGGPVDAANGYIQAATEGFEQVRGNVQGYAVAPQNPAQNTSPSYGTYPSTSTPHGYLTPCASAPSNTTPATPTTTIRRSSSPWRPGSTSDFQGSNTSSGASGGSTSRSSYKPALPLATAPRDVNDKLVLAVGDKYQFPSLLR